MGDDTVEEGGAGRGEGCAGSDVAQAPSPVPPASLLRRPLLPRLTSSATTSSSLRCTSD